MAKEAIKDAVVEDPKEEVETTSEDVNTKEEELSPWYYFFSQGCGWCKKATPVIEELNKEGYDILMLDLAEPDNQKLNQELKTEYKTQCGTPWFINAETGKGICGFREKDVVEKWLKGEEIPVPPRPTGPPPKLPFHGSTNKQNKAWKKEYSKWLKENKHMPKDWLGKQKSADDILKNPRPKSDPPRPPAGPSANEESLNKWGAELKKWQEENTHMPNLVPADQILTNYKARVLGQPQGAPPANLPGVGIGDSKINSLDARMQALETKLDRVMNHFGVK